MLNRVDLVNIAPPFRIGVADLTRPPAGILYVGGFLKQHGFDVRIHHIAEEEIEAHARRIAEGGCLFAGFSMMTGKQVALSADMSTRIKAGSPGTAIAWGGIHPSLLPEECLAYPFVDYVAIGEGERTALDLARLLQLGGSPENIPGLGFKSGERTFVTKQRPFEKNLDCFRQDWTLIDPERYVRSRQNRRSTFFITSRGYPHDCGFCYNQKFNQRKWRGHSAEFVINELRALKERAGIEAVTFDDDNFFTNRGRALAIIKGLQEIGISTRWVDLRVDYVREDLLRELTALDVKAIFMGWESGNDRTLQRIAKGFRAETILEKTKLLAGFRNLTVDASAIIAFPWETRKDIEQTISFALHMFRLNPFRMNFNLGVYVPFPGAPVTEEALRAGFSFPKDHRGWAAYDILSGEMRLPWLTARQAKRYALIDKYAKLLYVRPDNRPALRLVGYVLALLAYARLKSRCFFLPFEIWFYNIAARAVLRSKQRGK